MADGFRAVKMKVGGIPPREDAERLRAAREAVGPDIPVFLDANNAWSDVPSAIEAVRILEEVDACSEPGEIGRLLRREGLYSSHLSEWRRSRREGTLAALAPRKRGRKPKPRNPLDHKVARLEREKAALEEELRKARIIIDVQKKVAGLLGGIPDDEETS